MNQTHYIEKVVSKFSHLKIKDINTPFDSSVKLEKNDGRVVTQLEYASAIGSLMYVVTPLPSPGRREGARHGIKTPLPDFLTLVGPFRNINSYIRM